MEFLELGRDELLGDVLAASNDPTRFGMLTALIRGLSPMDLELDGTFRVDLPLALSFAPPCRIGGLGSLSLSIVSMHFLIGTSFGSAMHCNSNSFSLGHGISNSSSDASSDNCLALDGLTLSTSSAKLHSMSLFPS